MDDQRFEWDERKNKANQKKHGVTFEEARTAFLDENARVVPDPEHSDTEDTVRVARFEHSAAGCGGLSLLPRGRRRNPDYLGQEGQRSRA